MFINGIESVIFEVCKLDLVKAINATMAQNI